MKDLDLEINIAGIPLNFCYSISMNDTEISGHDVCLFSTLGRTECQVLGLREFMDDLN